jgi:hypothetical protein
MKKIIITISAMALTISATAQKTTLFTIDKECEDIVVAESWIMSNKVHEVERIYKDTNLLLYCFVAKLVSIARDPNCTEMEYIETDRQVRKIYRRK